MLAFDEMYASVPYADAPTRQQYQRYAQWLSHQPMQTMLHRREEAEFIFRRVGITFAVYGDKDADGSGNERLIPFDLIPRIIPHSEWDLLERGLLESHEKNDNSDLQADIDALFD